MLRVWIATHNFQIAADALGRGVTPCLFIGRCAINLLQHRVSIRIGNIDLSGSHVNDEFGELVGIAWTFAFADCHEPMMPQAGRVASTL